VFLGRFLLALGARKNDYEITVAEHLNAALPGCMSASGLYTQTPLTAAFTCQGRLKQAGMLVSEMTGMTAS
jgi:hypothetical protein